jgi:hypothetical protein
LQDALKHWSFAVHGAPAPPFAAHVPVAPGLWQYVVASEQSLSIAQDVLHEVESAQTKPPVHAAVVPPAQVPAPLHEAPVVSCPDAQTVQDVVFPGKAHAPLGSQSVAPQVPPVGLHAAVQQREPVPPMPQTPLVHWSIALHVAPAPPFATQVPETPGFVQYVVAGSAQSVSMPHEPRHAEPLAHLTAPGHALGLPGLHEPDPLHVPAGVSWPFKHEALPHDVEDDGNMHAPEGSQSLAPHVPPVGLHAAVQQREPVPAMPQTLLVH